MNRIKTNISDSWIFKTPIAHRGLHNITIPENSLAAFKNAAKHGYPAELDIHMLNDGGIAVLHDDTLNRMTGKNGLIEDVKTEDLKKLKLLDRNGNPTEEYIPTLKETLKLAEGVLPLLIELKPQCNYGLEQTGDFEDKIAEIMKDYKGDYAFISFNPHTLRALKKRMPWAYFGILVGNWTKEEFDDVNFTSGDFDFIDCWDRKLSCEWIRRYDCPILCYTIKSADEYNDAKKLSDNCTFEFPFEPQLMNLKKLTSDNRSNE